MIERYPSELNMLEVFGVTPYQSMPKDGFWSYEFSRKYITLKFSFNVFEGFIKSELYVKESLVEKVTHEGVHTIDLIQAENTIKCVCKNKHLSANLNIIISDFIYLEWNTLLN